MTGKDARGEVPIVDPPKPGDPLLPTTKPAPIVPGVTGELLGKTVFLWRQGPQPDAPHGAGPYPAIVTHVPDDGTGIIEATGFPIHLIGDQSEVPLTDGEGNVGRDVWWQFTTDPDEKPAEPIPVAVVGRPK
jgi:hypothetical protein